MEHGGEYPDTMPQAIKLIDAAGRSAICVPITQDGKVVDSEGYVFDPEDDDRWRLLSGGDADIPCHQLNVDP